MGVKSRTQYNYEFKQAAIRLVKVNGQSVITVAHSLGIDQSMLRRWIYNYEAKCLPGKPAPRLYTKEERDELFRLRREVLQLRTERDILKKALACFAKGCSETSTPDCLREYMRRSA